MMATDLARGVLLAVYTGSGLGRLAAATHVWFAAQAVLLVVIVPYAYFQLQLSPFELGLVLAVGGVGALTGVLLSTAVAIASALAAP